MGFACCPGKVVWDSLRLLYPNFFFGKRDEFVVAVVVVVRSLPLSDDKIRHDYYGTERIAGRLVNDGQNDDDQQHDADDAHDDHHLHVGPPLLPLQLSGPLLELTGPVLQRIRPAVQLRQLLVPLQNLLHVDAHDADHLVDLGLRLLQLVRGGRIRAHCSVTASGRLDAIGSFGGGHF